MFLSCPSGMTCYYDQYRTTWTDTYCTLKAYIDPYMLNTVDNYQGTYYGEWNTYVKVTASASATMMSMGLTSFYAWTMTVSTWIKTTDTGRSLISLGCVTDGSATTGSAFSLTIDDLGYLGFGEFSNDIGVGLYGSSQMKVNNGYRTHVAFVKGPGSGMSGSIGSFYVNGTLAGTLYSYSSMAISSYSDVQFVLGSDYCGIYGGATLTGEWQSKRCCMCTYPH
jgi:hypothetical protein